MALTKEEVTEIIKNKLKRSSFNVKCGLEVENVERGSLILSMKIAEDMTNPYKMAHGGALLTLMDTCGGVTCLTLGKNVVTLDMSTNFLKSGKLLDTVYATSKILHNGRSTVVGEVQIRDSQGVLLARSTTTYFVIGLDADIPTDWQI